MLALEVSLAVVVLGGSASALVLHQSPASAHKARPSGALPSVAPPSEVGAAELGAPEATQIPGNCIPVPHACGFPDGTNTGVPSGTALRSVPGQVSSGPG